MTGTSEVICQEVVAKFEMNKYFSKVLEVEGVTVPLPKPQPSDKRVQIRLAGVPKPGEGQSEVIATAAVGEEEKFKAIPTGQKVRILGFVNNTIFDVEMSNCTITDLGPGGKITPVRTVEEVTAAFAKDEAAARKEYNLSEAERSVLLIKGRVTEDFANGDFKTLRLVGVDGVAISVSIKLWVKGVTLPGAGANLTLGGLFEGYDTKLKTIRLGTGTHYRIH